MQIYIFNFVSGRESMEEMKASNEIWVYVNICLYIYTYILGERFRRSRALPLSLNEVAILGAPNEPRLFILSSFHLDRSPVHSPIYYNGFGWVFHALKYSMEYGPQFSSTLLELMLDTLTVTRKSPNLIHFYCQVTKEFSTTNEMIPEHFVKITMSSCYFLYVCNWSVVGLQKLILKIATYIHACSQD